MSANDSVRPFANGSEFMAWNEANCCHCIKAVHDPDGREPYKCDIQEAVEMATLTGEVTPDIAERMGYLDHSPPRAQGWTLGLPCKELVR